jgi:mono/diheme cytochrome c family protein
MYRMNRLVLFIAGALAAGGVGVTWLILQSDGFSARAKPGSMETWMARRIRTAAIPTAARDRSNPIANSPEVQAAARAHWADHCAICHGNDGSGETPMGSRTYPPAPDMRLSSTQQMTDGELFYIIENGIRFSGMPGWGSASGHDEQASWHLVHFIRHLPALTLAEKKEMERLNPKSPDEIKEEQEEEEFLKGETKNEPPTKHHH